MIGVHFIAEEIAAVTYRGQLYERLRIEKVVRKDGRPTSIATWRSTCAECREPYECTTSALMDRFQAPRRCQACRSKSPWHRRTKPPEPLTGMQRPFAPREDAE